MSLSLRTISPLSCAAIALFAIAIATGCNRGPSSQALSAQAPGVAATTPPIATPKPTPTPTPDPLQKYRAIQQVPTWAQKRIINEVPIKPGQKLFALTFDDGPWPESTEQILQILDQFNAKATFYMVGQMVRTYPQLARDVRDAGHSIGSHSWSHPSRPRDPVAEIQKTDAAIKKAIGVLPSSFRPPYGIVKNGMARQANRQNMPVIIWSADSNDWRRPSADTIARNVLRDVRPGGIALMHDGGGPRARTIAALPIILRELQGRGYRLVTIPELLKARYIAPPKPKKPKEKPAPARKPAAH